MNDIPSQQPAVPAGNQIEERGVACAPTEDRAEPGAPGPVETLAEVPLRLEVRLGETTLLIRDVLSLGPGSVITLDKRPDHAVDLVAGDRLIARGEIVVVDGELGVRIVEIAPGERR